MVLVFCFLFWFFFWKAFLFFIKQLRDGLWARSPSPLHGQEKYFKFLAPECPCCKLAGIRSPALHVRARMGMDGKAYSPT